MRISSVTKSNAGTYMCIATNDKGEATKTVHITGKFYSFLYKYNTLSLISHFLVLMKQLACTFVLNNEFGYTCIISNIQFLNGDIINIMGIHQDEKTNEDVTCVVFLNSKLIKIPIEIFETFRQLKTLVVKGTKLEIMDENTFELCGKLKYLDASDNKIRVINKSSLEKCTELETLNLHNNFITKIEPCNNFLTKLPKLKNLSLTQNMCIDQNFKNENLNEKLDELVFKDLYRCFSKWFL